jgi:hypothetical protein
MARPASRSNREDHPCPPGASPARTRFTAPAGPFGCHVGAQAAIQLRSGSIDARAMHDSTWHGKPAVLVADLDRAADPALRARPRPAEHLVGPAEMLAGPSLDQHGEWADHPRGGRGNRGVHTGAHSHAAARFRVEHPPRWFR